MFPCDVEMHGFDRHPFVQTLHVRPLVVVGPTEEVGQELDHGRVQFGDVRDVLQEEFVDSLV